MNSRLPCRQRRRRGMGFYSDLVLPRLLDHAMRNEELVGYRRRIAGRPTAGCWRSASARA